MLGEEPEACCHLPHWGNEGCWDGPRNADRTQTLQALLTFLVWVLSPTLQFVFASAPGLLALTFVMVLNAPLTPGLLQATQLKA